VAALGGAKLGKGPPVNVTNGPFTKPAQDAAPADIAQRFPGFARMRVL
jgi:hypothetical protein